MSNKIYIIGHKSPDLDSVASAVAYAYLKNKTDKQNEYLPQMAGEANSETTYAFAKFGLAIPEIMTEVEGKKLILVDHNESSQIVDGFEKGEIISIVDHHKMKFENNSPIFIHVEPIGSTCTIIAKMFKCKGVEITKEMAGIMLSGILIDTVIAKSPTCIPADIKTMEELGKIIGVDYKDFGMELFKVRSNVSKLTPDEIINSDHKDFEINNKKFNVAQVETVDITEFDKLKKDLWSVLQAKKEAGKYHTVIFFITDIMNEGSQFLVLSDEPEKFETAFATKLENNECYLTGVLSRKKQVIPVLMENY
jgi:manganese-dependent inorganic pyrophosphatase